MPHRTLKVRALTLAACLLISLFFVHHYRLRAQVTPPSFVEYESGPVRPVALSPDGTKLFAANIPNGSLEIFDVTAGGLSFNSRVVVGLEPVAVAARSNNEVWVVNHLSDSVSIVNLTGTPHVTATLLVGDEPRDIVFAGAAQRAFITTAHRGQQRTDASIAKVSGAGDPQLTTPGVPRADVWVFDPSNLGTTKGGTPLTILSFFTDTPRALAVSPDNRTVYVAGFQTGNQTTTVMQQMVCTGFNPNKPCTTPGGVTVPGGNPGPATDAIGQPAPEVGLVVKYNGTSGHWQDELQRNWDPAVRFSLPDLDVFAVDANSLQGTASFAHVGTTLFNMAVNPVNGNVYVSNNDANNTVRFEGPGTFGGHTVQGHIAEARITVISGSQVAPRHLNKHINYSVLASNPAFDVNAKTHSLSMPLGMVVSPDGSKLYVAAFGSSKIGVFNTATLENDTFDPVADSANYIPIDGGGPGGLSLDVARNRLYVATRFDNSLKVIDLGSGQQTASLAMPNPEPASVIQGRPFLYDATTFSGNGESSCASCHTFGDMDNLAWDLGNPDTPATTNPMTIDFNTPNSIANALQAGGVTTPLNGTGNLTDFNSMKGPMTTQTLKGLVNSGAMHWRGDRANGAFGIDPKDSTLSFENFVVAFGGLLGSPTTPTQTQMQTFANFQLQVMLPPNPIRNLDNSLTSDQQTGQGFFGGSRPSDGNAASGPSCNGCHVLDPSQGLFGTDRDGVVDGFPQVFKIPHLRNLYQKVGMFGDPQVSFLNMNDSGPMGNQIRGFGFLHDGSVETVFRFLHGNQFRPRLLVGFPILGTDAMRRNVEQYLLAFDSDLAPIVGQQVTLTALNATDVGPRIDLLMQRARASFTSKQLGGQTTECDLVAKVVQGGRVKGFLYNAGAGTFTPDDNGPSLSDAAMRALAQTAGQEVTYTAVPPGSGWRIAKTS